MLGFAPLGAAPLGTGAGDLGAALVLGRGFARAAPPAAWGRAFTTAPAVDGRLIAVVSAGKPPKFGDSKDPDDLSDWTFDFAGAMSPEDVVVAIDVVGIMPSNTTAVADPGTADLSLVAPLYGGQRATLWLADGKEAWKYEVAVLLRTAGGRTLRRRAELTMRPL